MFLRNHASDKLSGLLLVVSFVGAALFDKYLRFSIFILLYPCI